MQRQNILSDALRFRESELLNYDINIENYKRAIEKASCDKELEDFVVQLSQLLETETIERKKSKIMYDVILEQLEELNVHKN